MSYARLHTSCVSGAAVVPILVEVDIQPGLPVFSIIGLPDKGLEEARQRVRSAIRNSGLSFPLGRVTVNLSPSHLRKQGSSFDLAVALAILAATHVIPQPAQDMWVIGELGLEGEVRSASRLVALLIEGMRQGKRCMAPRQPESELVPECSRCLVGTLAEAVQALRQGPDFVSGSLPDVERVAPSSYAIDRVKGQPAAKRAVEIAVAGGHNLLLTGPPGTGKTMLARSAIQLFPLLSRSEHIDVMHIRSIAGLPLPFLGRPFREPHHTLSAASLVGGIQGRPGELALASKGVLFLDEFPHLPRESLEALRQPMQDKRVRLIKRGVEYEYPADCLIIAAQNNCPCGLTGLEGRSCHCTARDILRYRHAVSEPLLDRFDIFCEVPQPDPERVLGQDDDLSGSVMAARIQRARSVRAERGHGVGEGRQLSRPVSDLLEKAGTAFGLSARALDSLVRVARTIGDLEGADQVKAGHVQEALQYRRGPGIPL